MADLMVNGIGTDPISAIIGNAKSEEKGNAEPVFASMLSNLSSTASKPQINKLNVVETADNSSQMLTSENNRNKLVKENVATTEDNINPESVEKLQQYNDKIKEAVMDEYDLSEEELEAAMEELGLTYVELLIPQNLIALSMKVTDADTTIDLLQNEGFNELFQIMQDMTMELTQEMNITPDMLEEFVGMLANDNELPNSGEELISTEENVNLNTEEVLDNIDQTVNESEVEAINGLAKQVETIVTEGIKKGTVEVNVTKTDETSNELEVTEVEDETIMNNGVAERLNSETEENAEEFGESKENSNGSKTGTQNSKQSLEVENGISTSVSSFSRIADSIQEMTMAPVESFTQVDTESIIRQINDFMKLNISDLETSLEMQLNPANLGKIALNVSVKEGMVTAQLAVENEAVKQALESQMMILRDNMNNQGLKVEAVEVTIASHEFEQNLENNFAGQRENNPENPKEGRRSIMASDLTSIEELSQDDQLAAKIMVQNGNRMDISA